MSLENDAENAEALSPPRRAEENRRSAPAETLGWGKVRKKHFVIAIRASSADLKKRKDLAARRACGDSPGSGGDDVGSRIALGPCNVKYQNKNWY
jgi:hypothetical protein